MPAVSDSSYAPLLVSRANKHCRAVMVSTPCVLGVGVVMGRKAIDSQQGGLGNSLLHRWHCCPVPSEAAGQL